MTYMEVASRLAGLLYVKHQQRWIDPSYLDLFSTFLRHAENRFTKASVCYEVQFLDEIGDPNELVKHFATKYPDIATTVISSEDVQYFLHSCRRRGMKPVPFIPLFDEDFAVWLLKDTFRQCEDADALVDQDIQRTFILHGPLSARYSTKVDEPVKDILDGIYDGQTSALLDWYYGGDKSRPGLAYSEVELRMDESSVITVCVNHATLDKIYPWELNYSTEGMFNLFSLPLASPGFLNLVHRSNQMELADNFDLLKVGDVVDYDICIGELFNTVAGKQLQVQSVFYKGGEVFAKTYSTFIFRDIVVDNTIAFKHVAEPVYQLEIKSQLD
ncbi:hypothetical protein EC988_005394, partial [Linderina pennispora]